MLCHDIGYATFMRKKKQKKKQGFQGLYHLSFISSTCRCQCTVKSLYKLYIGTIAFIVVCQSSLDTLNTSTHHYVSVDAGLFQGCGFSKVPSLPAGRTPTWDDSAKVQCQIYFLLCPMSVFLTLSLYLEYLQIPTSVWSGFRNDCDHDLLIKMGPGGLPLEVFSSRSQSSPEHLRGIWPRNSLLPQQPEAVAGEKLPPVLDKLDGRITSNTHMLSY